MRHDPGTPHIDNTQRTEGSRTDVERDKMKQKQAGDEADNARKLDETRKGSNDAKKTP